MTAESLGLKPGWYNVPITAKACESCRYCRKWNVPFCAVHQVHERGQCACRMMKGLYGPDAKCGVCRKIPSGAIPVYFPIDGLRPPPLPAGMSFVSAKPKTVRPEPVPEVPVEDKIETIRKKRSKKQGYNYW